VKGKKVFDERFVVDYIEAKSEESHICNGKIWRSVVVDSPSSTAKPCQIVEL